MHIKNNESLTRNYLYQTRHDTILRNCKEAYDWFVHCSESEKEMAKEALEFWRRKYFIH